MNETPTKDVAGRRSTCNLPSMQFDEASLARHGRRISEARNSTKADVYLVRDGNRTLVVKTIAGRPALARLLVSGPLLRREGRILARLRGMRGVPKLVAETRTALVSEQLPGDTLFTHRKTGISPETADRMRSLLAELHARDVTHGDIGRRDILLAPDGSVSFVDFATAIGRGAPPLVWRLLLAWWKRRDVASLEKLVRRYRRRWDRCIALAAEAEKQT